MNDKLSNVDNLYIPNHYTFRKMDCNDLTSVILFYEPSSLAGYYLGNIIKYVYRHPMKDKEKDIVKLETYIKRYRSCRYNYKFNGTIQMLIKKAMQSPTDKQSIESASVDAELLIAVISDKWEYALALCRSLRDHYGKLSLQQLSVFDEPDPFTDDEEYAIAAMNALEDKL